MFNRKVLVVLVCLGALGAASSASAGGSIFVGADFPTGGFGDTAKTGWTAGAYYTGNLMPIVELGGLVAYNDWTLDLGETPELAALFGDSINAWEVHALGQLNFLMLKAFLGLGFANYNGIGDDLESKRETDFSWQLGVSFNFAMLQARLSYHQIPVEDNSINWMKLTIGVTF